MQENAIAPVKSAERINELDMIRGVALLGILMVNMALFKSPFMDLRLPSHYPEGIERVSAYFIQLFFTGNFYAIFSFLFGLGFFIFMERTIQKGLELKPLYRRRLFALMVFGLIHLIIFWSGDILFNYALVGFILLAFRDKPLQSIKKWIISLFILSFILNMFMIVFKGIGEIIGDEKYHAVVDQMLAETILKYTEAGFVELLLFRLANEVPYIFFGVVFWIPQVLAFFLCGLYVGKKGIFKDIPSHITLFKKIRLWGFLLGGLLLILLVLFDSGAITANTLVNLSMLSGTNYLASLFLFPAYVSTIVLAAQSATWNKILSPVASAGKMALTNYLSQTLICVVIFYGFGFGLFGQLAVYHGIMLTVAIFLLQVFWSTMWMKRFRFGPMEWIWRNITYKKRFPISR